MSIVVHLAPPTLADFENGRMLSLFSMQAESQNYLRPVLIQFDSGSLEFDLYDAENDPRNHTKWH